MQQLNVKAYIRFDDAKVSKLSYESETHMFTMEPLPLVHRAPPQTWLTLFFSDFRKFIRNVYITRQILLPPWNQASQRS